MTAKFRRTNISRVVIGIPDGNWRHFINATCRSTMRGSRTPPRMRTSRIRPSGYPFAFRASKKSEIAGRIVRRRPLTLRYRTGHRSEGSQQKQPQLRQTRVSSRQDEIQARIEGRSRDRSPMPRSPADFSGASAISRRPRRQRHLCAGHAKRPVPGRSSA